MNIKNFEFKAKVDDLGYYEQRLSKLDPVFIGTDHQVDTYFKVQKGRLKLREGNIENSLINYNRENITGLKSSDIILYNFEPNPALKNILALQLGIKSVVSKTRNIYFIENVKFHFDKVENLGAFIEVEAIDTTGAYDVEYLQSQCEKYYDFFGIKKINLVDRSYSDLIEEL